jgi:hypothetical protein
VFWIGLGGVIVKRCNTPLATFGHTCKRNMTDQERQQILDEEHLRLLRIGYLVGRWIDAVLALFPLIYVAMGLFFALGGLPTTGSPNEPNPAFIGAFFVLLVAQCRCSLPLARDSSSRPAVRLGADGRGGYAWSPPPYHAFQSPWGTVLGVFTFMVLGERASWRSFGSGEVMLRRR